MSGVMAKRAVNGRFATAWSAEHEAILRDHFIAGATDAEIGRLVGRPTSTVASKRKRMGISRRDYPGETSRPEWQGGRRFAPYWTPERVAAALLRYAREHPGTLPRGTHAWSAISRGDPSLPAADRVLSEYGALTTAWRELLGRSEYQRRVPSAWARWTAEEDAFLEEQAGRLSWSEIAERLGRSHSSVVMHARRSLGLHATEQREYWSPRDVAEHYGCPLTRVYQLVWAGTLPAVRNGRVRIDARHLPGVSSDAEGREVGQTAEARAALEAALRAPHQRLNARRRRPQDVITRVRPRVIAA